MQRCGWAAGTLGGWDGGTDVFDSALMQQGGVQSSLRQHNCTPCLLCTRRTAPAPAGASQRAAARLPGGHHFRGCVGCAPRAAALAAVPHGAGGGPLLRECLGSGSLLGILKWLWKGCDGLGPTDSMRLQGVASPPCLAQPIATPPASSPLPAKQLLYDGHDAEAVRLLTLVHHITLIHIHPPFASLEEQVRRAAGFQLLVTREARTCMQVEEVALPSQGLPERYGV